MKKKLIDLLKSQSNLRFSGGVSDNNISEAESKLGLKFSNEYKDYLREFGMANFGPCEFTGLRLDGKNDRCDVVKLTLELRDITDDISPNMYVIYPCDDLQYFQDTSGTVYCSIEGRKPQKTNNSFADFVEEQLKWIKK